MVFLIAKWLVVREAYELSLGSVSSLQIVRANQAKYNVPTGGVCHSPLPIYAWYHEVCWIWLPYKKDFSLEINFRYFRVSITRVYI